MIRSALDKFAIASISLALCTAVSACGSAGDDPVVAERDLPEAQAQGRMPAQPVTAAERENLRYARSALDCVNRQYPSEINHVLNSAEDVTSPKQQHPAFYGCLNWHSAVHNHWMLTRLWGRGDVPELDGEITAVLSRSLTPENIETERAYFIGEDRDSFERPYGMVWFLLLTQELRDIAKVGGTKGAKASAFQQELAPLETTIVDELKSWLMKLGYPIRNGTRGQTAFALGLIIDWAKAGGDEGLGRLAKDKAREFYADNESCPIGYEPSGEDVLSPCLMTADLMRRIMPPEKFAEWLTQFLPDIPRDAEAQWLPTVDVNDPTDLTLVQLNGLNLSRAWALRGIARGLPASDTRREILAKAAAAHRKAGLVAAKTEFYAASHWLPSFAVYLETKRGLGPVKQKAAADAGEADGVPAP